MKKLFFLLATITLLAACGQEELAPPASRVTNLSRISGDSILIDVVSEVPGLLIVIAETEEDTYLPAADPDCGQYIQSSHWFVSRPIFNNFESPVMRVEVGGVTESILEL